MFKNPGSFGKTNNATQDSRFPLLKPQPLKPVTPPAPSTVKPVIATNDVAPEQTATKAAAGSDHDSSIGNCLIVGPDVKLKGAEINDCDTLIVEGRVEATLDSRIIRIAEQGSFNGTVGVETAEIRGRFDGELTARGQLLIHATGHVNGKIRYSKILIEEGGQISGDVQTITANAASIQTTIKPKPVVSAV